MLHGITSNGRGWDPVSDRLSHRFRAIKLDQRGHGRSGKPKGAFYSRDDFTGDVAGLIELLDAGPAVVAGHSLGARNALALGAARPELVSAVIAIEFTPFIEDAAMDRLDERVAGGDYELSSLDEIRAYLSDRYPLMPADAIGRRTRFGYREVDGGGYRPLADGAITSVAVFLIANHSAFESPAVQTPYVIEACRLPDKSSARGCCGTCAEAACFFC